MVLCAAQLLWRWGIYDRWLNEPIEQRFIDLCTLAKVSIILLPESHFGYYLHCRSPYPYADDTMEEMLNQLEQEEAGLTTDRGLEGAPAEVQTFKIYLTNAFRDRYDKIYGSLTLNKPMTAAHRERKRTGRPSHIDSQSMGRLLKGRQELNTFLQVGRFNLNSITHGLQTIFMAGLCRGPLWDT